MDLINTSERNWDDTPVEIPPEVVQTIIAGIERLQHEQFHNTTTVIPTITFDSLLLNHRASNSDYPNETLAEFGPEFPTVELGAEFDGDQAPSGCDIELPKTNLNRVMYSNVREYGTDLYAEICPTSNNCGSGVEENSTITAIRIQLQQQREKFLALQENMLGLNGQIKQRYETILEFPRQLNTEHEFHRLNVPTIDQQLQLPLQTKVSSVYQVPTSEHFDGTHSEIAETITTNQLSSLRYSGRTEQFQEIDILHSSTGDVTRSEDDAELHCESEHPTPSYQEDSFNLSEESFRMKQLNTRSSERM
ncbi:uncharacterized protein LOC119083281 [Bradysia coprophila]|uniref:uncharacterized protein LOC119083281 n=1 Tax=Bradysia coprophila TaxID=38358 RepID=UPI00187DBE32|nr:uncharacterized protein LOC119083281 [Bradysia coprophila]